MTAKTRIKQVESPLLVEPLPEETKAPIGAVKNTSRLVDLQAFARRLNELMVQAGMNQSQLAAAVFGTTRDTRNFTVARGRDRISNYLRGRDVPRPQNLAKIAKVFDMSVKELAPELTESALDRGDPAISMHMVAGRPNEVRLTVNTLVDLATAAQVVALLSKSQSSTSTISGGA